MKERHSIQRLQELLGIVLKGLDGQPFSSGNGQRMARLSGRSAITGTISRVAANMSGATKKVVWILVDPTPQEEQSVAEAPLYVKTLAEALLTADVVKRERKDVAQVYVLLGVKV